jgi:hypothetical protein
VNIAKLPELLLAATIFIGHWPIPSKNPYLRREQLLVLRICGISDKGSPTHARGRPVPKICNRVPGHGSTGFTKRKQAGLEQSSGAMASLREAN